jgi:Fe-S protein assembly co-chaperone HscB
MNHFELFQLPEALDIDLAALKKQFLNLQQQYHPDKAADKDQALIKSSEINQAFKVLSQVDSRAAYLLALKNKIIILINPSMILNFYNQHLKCVNNLMRLDQQINYVH